MNEVYANMSYLSGHLLQKSRAPGMGFPRQPKKGSCQPTGQSFRYAARITGPAAIAAPRKVNCTVGDVCICLSIWSNNDNVMISIHIHPNGYNRFPFWKPTVMRVEK